MCLKNNLYISRRRRSCHDLHSWIIKHGFVTAFSLDYINPAFAEICKSYFAKAWCQRDESDNALCSLRPPIMASQTFHDFFNAFQEGFEGNWLADRKLAARHRLPGDELIRVSFGPSGERYLHTPVNRLEPQRQKSLAPSSCSKRER